MSNRLLAALCTVFILAAILATSGCSKDLTRPRVKRMVEASKRFAKPIKFTFREGRNDNDFDPLSKGDREAAWKNLEREQLVQLEYLGLSDFGPPFLSVYSLTITDKGREVFTQTDDGTWSLDAARRVLIDVTGIQTAPFSDKLALAEYTWTYEATSSYSTLVLPGLGLKPEDLGKPRKDKASFQLFDDGWRMDGE